MVITFTAVLIGFLVLIRPLQKNSFYVLHSAIVILSAYYVEANIFHATPFVPKTFLLLLVFHLISINLVTFWAYYVDKKAAKNKKWRVSEKKLHTLEFLGGWSGALLGQRLFNHKTNKKDFITTFWLLTFAEVAIIYVILKFLRVI